MSVLDRAIAVGHQKIDGEIHAAITMYQNKIAAKVVSVQQKASAAEAMESQLPATIEACPLEVDDVLGKAGAEVSRLSLLLEKAERNLTAFAARHGLCRLANVPVVPETCLVLSLLVFIEGAINSAFFLNAHMSAGPLSALLLSMLISGTNIAVSAAAGYWIGRKMDWGVLAVDGDTPQFVRKRVVARWQLALFIALAALFHLTVGLIRSQEQLSTVHHSLDAYAQLMATPESLFLILIGSVMTLLGFHKGKHGFDDPYPGYGALQRSVDDLGEQRIALQERSAEEIESRFEAAHRWSVKQTASAGKAYERYNTAVADCHRAHNELQQLVSQAEGELRAQVAQIVTLFAVSAGVSGALSADELDRLCTLRGSNSLNIPPYKHAPDDIQYRALFENAKADALSQLNGLFAPSKAN